MQEPVNEPKSPDCRDCNIPATFRTSISTRKPNERIDIYQCPNCARLIWTG